MADAATPLQVLQEQFALARLDGNWYVVDRQRVQAIAAGRCENTIDYFKKGGDADLLLSRKLETLPMPCKPLQVIQEFYRSPETHTYERVVFDPTDADPNAINLWSPPTVKPLPGDWGVLREYIENTLCGGDAEASGYLLQFLAHALQRPSEKPTVMVVFLGGQGTGKGMFFKLLRALWGYTTLMVSSVDQVVGHFNASLERAFIVFMDEALFRGDKKSTERLKSIVSEDVIHVEQKYQPSRSVRSVHRFFATSNAEHFAHIDPDDRRMFYVRVSDERQQDLDYFGRIDRALADPTVVGALADHLLKTELAGFQVRARPRTGELARQKLKSLTGFERYWFDVLATGEFGDVLEGGWAGPHFVPSEVLMAGWRGHDRMGARFDAPQANELAAKLRRVCPSATHGRHVVKPLGQRRGVSLPALAVARKEFEAFIGGPVTWDDSGLADGGQDAAPSAGTSTAAVAEHAGRNHATRIPFGMGGELPPLPPLSQ